MKSASLALFGFWIYACEFLSAQYITCNCWHKTKMLKYNPNRFSGGVGYYQVVMYSAIAYTICAGFGYSNFTHWVYHC